MEEYVFDIKLDLRPCCKYVGPRLRRKSSRISLTSQPQALLLVLVKAASEQKFLREQEVPFCTALRRWGRRRAAVASPLG